MSYGPRWGPTSLAASPSYIARKPPKIPGYDPNSPYGWSGYPVKPTTPKPKGTTKAAGTAAAGTGTPTMDELIRQIYGGMESPADQEARVKREVDEQIQAQQKMIDDMYARQRADALRVMQAESAAGGAAAAMSGDLFRQVGGEYNQAASEIAGLSHGLTGGAAAATAGDVAALNAHLSATGNAPVQQGGDFGVGGATQQGVEDYRSGTLGSQYFTGMGQGALFGLAGQISAQNLRATQEAEGELHTTLSDLRGKESDAINALAAGRPDLYQKLKADAQDSRIKALTLVQGLIAQKQANAANAAKLKQQAAMDAWTRAKWAADFGLKKGKFGLDVTKTKADIGYKKAQIDLASGRLTLAQNVADAKNKLAVQKELRQALKDQVAAGAVDVNRSKALKHVVDKQGNPVLDASGKWIPSSYLSSPLTAGQMQKTQQQAESMADKFYFGTVTDAKGKVIPATQGANFNPDDPSTFGKVTTPYTSALRQMMRSGIPEDVARKSLNSRYIRGNAGRPYFSQTEKSAIAQAYIKRYGKATANQHYVGLLNTLHRFYQNYISEYQNGNTDNATGWKHQFDQLVQRTLASVGMA